MYNKYEGIIKECFPYMKGSVLESVFDAAKISERHVAACADFRKAIEKSLEDEGFSKKKRKAFMELYEAAFAVGNSVGAVMFAMATDDIKTNHLFDL